MAPDGRRIMVGHHLEPTSEIYAIENLGAWLRNCRTPAPAAASSKRPRLREIARTAPYMHDGSLPTLEAVVEFYDGGGRPNPSLDPEIRPLRFTDAEKRQLVAFLHTLSGEVQEGPRGRAEGAASP